MSAYYQWLLARAAVIRETVSLADLLSSNGHSLRYGGARPEQMFCPFHANNRTMAAKYHPADDRGPAAVYCFVCQKRRDIIEAWKFFHGQPEDKFSATVRTIERAYHITPPDMPAEAAPALEDDPDARAETEVLLYVCERRLRAAREHFDMRAYLTVGAVLDRVHENLGQDQCPLDPTKQVLRTVLDKIGARCRAS